MDSVTSEWFDRNRCIVRMKIEGDWDVYKFLAAQDQALVYAEEVNEPVYVLIEFGRVHTRPEGLLTNMPEIAHSDAYNSDLIRMIIPIGAPRLLETFIMIFKKAFREQGKRLHPALTVEDALNIIDRSAAVNG